MVTVALDTAEEPLGVAITVAGTPPKRVEHSSSLGLRHAETLMPTLDRILSELGHSPDEVSLIICAEGPGSFTGLRIGHATAKGISAGSGAPIVTVPTLQATAYSFSVYPGLVVPVLDARKKRVYAALFADGEQLSEDLDATPQELIERIRKAITTNAAFEEHPPLIMGTGSPQLERVLADSSLRYKSVSAPLSRAAALLDLGTARYERGEIATDAAGPSYVRLSDAELGRGGNTV